MTALRRTATTALAFFLGGSVITTFWWQPPVCLAQGNAKNTMMTSFAPLNLRERFHRYAIRDASGRGVLTPTGFLACLCLLDEEEMQILENTGPDCLSFHIRQRLEYLFHLMDLDHDKSITYTEFCIFLSLISARRKHLEIAFGVFDKNEDHCLSRHEFRHLLNALMVDDSVQVGKKKRSLGWLMPSRSTQDAVYSLEMRKEKKSVSQEIDSSLSMTKDALFESPLVKHLFGPNGDYRISFDEFFSIIREIRQDVWELQFGLHDPNNTGLIAIADFQRILFRGIGKIGDANNSGNYKNRSKRVEKGEGEEERLTSWEFYRKTFEILFEYDAIARGIELALKAKTPLPLSSSIIATKSQDNEQNQEKMKATGSEMTRISLSGNDSGEELDSAEFHRVLESCQGVPHLTQNEVEYLMRVFDLDGSGKLSPSEFERVCQLCTTFFSPRQPRFTEPRRNAVQQFFFCMQQLK
ncbi:EF-hand domain [Trypanosoma melophagium]|uniref:EF-hand domain n=1 Tax=Trypanosoma melophagium TaxID=715481 RepID=UPI00351A5A5A|nr:EF-hand domain [Trypanosoma melophagium]